MSTVIKPCPICGSKANIVKDSNDIGDDDDVSSWLVECNDYDNCGFFISSTVYLSYNSALTLWNNLSDNLK